MLLADIAAVQIDVMAAAVEFILTRRGSSDSRRVATLKIIQTQILAVAPRGLKLAQVFLDSL